MVTNRSRRGRYQTLILAIVGLLVMGVALVSCSTPAEPQLCRDSAAEYLAEVDALNDRWEDAVTLAGSTSRIALGPVVADLQAIQREAEAMTVPACATVLHQRLTEPMDEIINGFLFFMQSGDTEYLTLAVELSAYYAHEFDTGFAAIMAGIDLTPTSTP